MFVFTAGEQEFYANKGLMNEPTRCQSCRSARRTSQSTLEQNDGYVRYGNFASFGGKTPRQMHPAARFMREHCHLEDRFPLGEQQRRCRNGPLLRGG